MTKVRSTLSGLLLAVIAGCAEEPPPPSVGEYVADKILLDAAMARCAQNRATMKYAPECVNAREAASILARDEELERRKQLEAQSERKRAALRRAQVAADEARRRSAEAARKREEAAYLAQFSNPDEAPPMRATTGEEVPSAAPQPTAYPAGQEQQDEPVREYGAPISTPPPAESEPAGDLEAIREELRRRQDPPQE